MRCQVATIINAILTVFIYRGIYQRKDGGPPEDQTCYTGEDCAFAQLLGVALHEDDVVGVLSISDACGTAAPSAQVAVGEFAAPVLTAANVPAAGTHRLCHCAISASDCSAAAHFAAQLGSLIVAAPPASLDGSADLHCHAQMPCSFVVRASSGLDTTDKVILVVSSGTCGLASAVAGQMFSGTMSGDELTYAIGTKSQAYYKVCHCDTYDGADTDLQTCNSITEYRNTVGFLTIVGSVSLGETICTAGVPCTLGTYSGQELGTDDRVSFIVDPQPPTGGCGKAVRDTSTAANDAAGVVVPRMVGGVYKQVASDLTVALAATDLPQGGRWQVCYCAHLEGADDDDFEACTDKSEYVTLVGIVTVNGPYPNNQDRTCPAGCDCVLGGNLGDGFVGLDVSATDKVSIIPYGGTCGFSEQDTSYYGSGYTSLALNAVGTTATLGASTLKRGGKWKVCYCTSYGGCDEKSEFTVLAGLLTIVGPSPNSQVRTCTVGIPCTWPILGQGITVSRDIVWFIDLGGDCRTSPLATNVAQASYHM